MADLFAGSGALGIEALSRGAASVHFVESDRRAAEVDRRQPRGPRARRPGRRRCAARWRRRSATCRRPLDLVLADPPYAFDGWAELLATAAPAARRRRRGGRRVGPVLALPAGWEKVRERTYGGTVVLFARPELPRTDVPEPTGAHA